MYVANVNSTMHDIVYNNRELYHGERWWQDQRYYAPMATIDNTALFVRDRVLLHHPVFGDTVCTVKQFYMEVTLHLHVDATFSQAKSDEIHLLVDILLTFQQFQTVVEDPSLYHLSNDMAVLFEEGLSVPLSSVLGPVRKAVAWPKSIAIWNNSTHTLSEGESSRKACSHSATCALYRRH